MILQPQFTLQEAAELHMLLERLGDVPFEGDRRLRIRAAKEELFVKLRKAGGRFEPTTRVWRFE